MTLGEKYVGLKPQSLNFTEAGSLPLVSLTSLAALKSVGAPWAPGAQGPEKNTNIKSYSPEMGFHVLPADPGRRATSHD